METNDKDTNKSTQQQQPEAKTSERLRVYNLIVLDESGSMSSATQATINGCNETINVAKSADKDNLEQMISIYAFQSDDQHPSRYLVKNVPAKACEHITNNDYQPWGCTPLYDAVGMTLVDLKATVKAHPGSIGAVTIITDGYENSSREYTLKKVIKLIDEVKEMGWIVTFIGANIDAKSVGASLHIDATLQFDADEEGVGDMFAQELDCRKKSYASMSEAYDESPQDIIPQLRKINKSYFKK